MAVCAGQDEEEQTAMLDQGVIQLLVRALERARRCVLSHCLSCCCFV